MNNTALAHFLLAIGQLNDIKSTLPQIKRALDQESPDLLNQDKDDVAILQDAQKGINVAQNSGFSVDGIIAINTAFNSASDEEPTWPGHLRNAFYNEDDRIGIIVNRETQQLYTPPEVVTRQDLQTIVERYNHSSKHETDAWRVFVDLAKLQPFQDGNKRTALIAANAACGVLTSQCYLILPVEEKVRAGFMNILMQYYAAESVNARGNVLIGC